MSTPKPTRCPVFPCCLERGHAGNHLSSKEKARIEQRHRSAKTATDFSVYIGRTCTLEVPKSNLTVRVRILDAKRVYGRLLMEVSPLGSTSRDWVNFSSLTNMDEEVAR